VIKFAVTEEKPCVNFLLFYTIDPLERGLSCGGDEVNLSNPLVESYSSC
jgi:hypothetical protein